MTGVHRVGLLPCRLVHRLSVEVDVEEDGARRAGHEPLAVDQRRGRRLPDFRFHAAAIEHLAEELGVALDIGQVGPHIGNRHQVHELADDGLLVLTNVSLDIRRLCESLRRDRERTDDSTEESQDAFHSSQVIDSLRQL